MTVFAKVFCRIWIQNAYTEEYKKQLGTALL